MVVLIMAVPNVDGQFMKASEGQFLAGIQRTCGNRCFKARSWTYILHYQKRMKYLMLRVQRILEWHRERTKESL